MSCWFAGLALALALASAAQAAPVLPTLMQGNGELNPAWRVVGFPKKHADIPLTRFEADRVDGEAALKVVTAASYGTLLHQTPGAPPGRLQWRWRLDQPLSGGQSAADLSTKAGDDAALKICALFDHPLERVPFVERTVLRLARSLSGEALPAATVCYVWDSAHAAGLRGVNPYTRRVRYISLRGSEMPTRQWVTEARDLAQDFSALFADEMPSGSAVPRVRSVLIGADSDNTASHSTGWVTELGWAVATP